VELQDFRQRGSGQCGNGDGCAEYENATCGHADFPLIGLPYGLVAGKRRSVQAKP